MTCFCRQTMPETRADARSPGLRREAGRPAGANDPLCDACEPGPVQAKLAVGAPDDPLEREADRIADRVAAGHASGPMDGAPIRVQPAGGKRTRGMQTAPPSVARVLASDGRPLAPAVRQHMARRFGHDFFDVRVHDDAPASASAQDIAARAYTAGRHIVFAAGQYAPGTHEGFRLLAHELTHVVQQSAPSTGGGATIIARAPGTELPKGSNFTPEQWKLLVKARENLKPAGNSIVGVLIAEDGRHFEVMSGGGQGFSSHIEGKATARMNELGIKNAVLLSELEPCQLCDRSDYPSDLGPEAPLQSTATGKEISRQTPKINSALPKGAELKVVGPKSTGIYRGIGSGVTAPGAPPGASGGATETKPSKAPSGAPTSGVAKSTPPLEKGKPPSPTTPGTGTAGTQGQGGSAPAKGGLPGKAPAPSPAPASTPSGAKEAVAGKSKISVEIKAGRAQLSMGSAWKWAGRAGTAATFALQLYGAIESIDSAVTRIEKAQSGNVRPEVALAMASVDANFPSAKTMWSDKFNTRHEDVGYPVARDWLINNGFQALIQKGAMLGLMGDHLNTLYWYYNALDDLAYDLNRYREQLDPVYQDIKKRTGALFDIAKDLLAIIPNFPVDTIQVQLFGLYQTFHDAAEDIARLENQLSGRVTLYEQFYTKARADRKEAARWINYWFPGYEKVLGKKLTVTRVPED